MRTLAEIEEHAANIANHPRMWQETKDAKLAELREEWKSVKSHLDNVRNFHKAEMSGFVPMTYSQRKVVRTGRFVPKSIYDGIVHQG